MMVGMADIFISYATEDRAESQRFAQAFERVGWTVWWDHKIPAGRKYVEFIKEQLDSSKCTVVLWSKSSVESEWVEREAKRANDQKKMIPVLIEEITPPWVFEDIQTRDLSLWQGETDEGNFPQLASDMTRLLGKIPHPEFLVNKEPDSTSPPTDDDAPQSHEIDKDDEGPQKPRPTTIWAFVLVNAPFIGILIAGALVDLISWYDVPVFLLVLFLATAFGFYFWKWRK